MLRNKAAVRTGFPRITKKSEDDLKEDVNCDKDKSITGYDTSLLATDEKFLWYAYDYGFERAYRYQDYTPSDPGRLWYMPRFVEQAENYFKDQITSDKCARGYGIDHCARRWHAKGDICLPQCAARIPDYAPPLPGSEPVRQSKEPWRYRVAAAYRWAMANGNPMPTGLNANSQRVRDLVAKYEANSVWAEQDRERDAARARITGDGKNPDGTPTPEAIAYVELCSRQIRANMARFTERNTQATRPLSQPQPNQISADSLPSRAEPVYPDQRSIAELLESLGVRSTERKQEPPP
jgi:hypothetical protein